MNNRLDLLDGIRGILMINAMIYHVLWDLVFIYGVRLEWYKGVVGHVWQQCICCGFILLSGICWRLGKSVKGHLKNGLIVFLCGMAISMVTAAVTPESIVIFGILTLIGSCMLLFILLDKLVSKVPSGMGAAVSLLLFVLFKSVNTGSLLWGAVSLPQWLYKGIFMTYIGFMEKGFYSSDYFSLLPWVFLYLTGYFISPMIKKNKLTECKIPAADFVGKHSLIFYLAHQPVFYFLLKLGFSGY